MNKLNLKPLIVGLALAFPVASMAQVDNAELLRELQDLKAKVKALEDKINGAPSAEAPGADTAVAPVDRRAYSIKPLLTSTKPN